MLKLKLLTKNLVEKIKQDFNFNAELIGGVKSSDKIKVWNKTEPIKRGEVESEEDDNKND